MSIRYFTTVSKRSFQKEATAQFIKTATRNLPNQVIGTTATPVKWTPTHGHSFRSFAEYRLRVINLSPLGKVKAQ